MGSRSWFSWTLFSCTVTHVFVHVFTFMHIALIPVFMAEFGLSIFESGLLVSIPLVLSVSISLPYGLLADRIGPRKLLAGSLLLSGFSGLAIALANDFYALLLPLTLISLSSTLYHPPALSIVSELLPQNQRNKALGIHGAGGASGVAIGPITLGVLMGVLGWRITYLLWVLPIFLSILFLLKLPKASTVINLNAGQKADPHVANEGGNPRTSRYGYGMLLVAMTINGIGGQSVSTYMTTYLVSNRGLTESIASLVYGLNALIAVLGSLTGGYLADFFGSKRWMVIAYVGGLTVLTGVYLGPLWALIVFYLIGGYFGGSTMGPSSSLVAEFSAKERRGLAYTIFMLPFSLMGAVSPVIAAKIIESYEIYALFPFAIALSMVSVFFLELIPGEKTRSALERAAASLP